MRFGSVCSGIEAAAVAWHPLGWRAAWCAEIEPFPSAVLAHHYPEVPNMGDMTKLPDLVRLGLLEAPDVLVGGTPCQAFSVAGLRNSLDDDRGNLTLSYFHLLDAVDHARAERNEPAGVAVWENTDTSTLPALTCSQGAAVAAAMQVRRLTPRECERVQGFPDDYSLVPHRNKPAADGPRYKALGNSMAVPCMAWIGARIAAALP